MRNYKFLIGLLFVGAVQAQHVQWVKPFLPSVPEARCCGNMAYDSDTHSTLLFSGGGPVLDDTWIFTRANDWTQVFPETSPPPTSGGAFVYDPLSKTAVLFGGNPGSFYAYLDTTWTWDGSTWTQQFPPVSPSPRAFNVEPMAFDAASGTSVLFGGFGDGLVPLGDTWVWNGLTKRWTERFPVNSPSPRATTVAYDYSTKQVIIFGGDGPGVFLGDTWTWDGTTWTQRFPPTSPSPRGDHMMAYDPNLGGVVLFGGNTENGYVNDTWLWKGSTWTQIPTRSAPSPRTAASIVYDPNFQGLIMFGGAVSGGFSNETWLFIKK